MKPYLRKEGRIIPWLCPAGLEAHIKEWWRKRFEEEKFDTRKVLATLKKGVKKRHKVTNHIVDELAQWLGIEEHCWKSTRHASSRSKGDYHQKLIRPVLVVWKGLPVWREWRGYWRPKSIYTGEKPDPGGSFERTNRWRYFETYYSANWIEDILKYFAERPKLIPEIIDTGAKPRIKLWSNECLHGRFTLRDGKLGWTTEKTGRWHDRPSGYNARKCVRLATKNRLKRAKKKAEKLAGLESQGREAIRQYREAKKEKDK